MEQYRSGQFTDALYPIMDGVGSVALNYAKYLTAKGHPSYLFGPEVPGYTESDPMVIRFPSLPVPFNKPWRIGVAGAHVFRSRLDQLSLDIVHAHSPFTAGHEALRYAREAGIPVVATFHSKYREDFMRALKFPRLADSMVRHVVDFYEQVDEVWVPNDLTGQTLLSYGYRGGYRIARNGTDMHSMKRDKKEELRSQFLRSCGRREEVLCFLFVGQHRKEKNVMLILDALSSLHGKGVDFHAFFVGSGPDESAMKQKVAASPLKDHVVFTGPVHDRGKLVRLYAAADVYLFPSLYDNSALTIREAASCGVPTVAVRGSTTAEGLRDRENAFLIDNSIDSFSSLLQELQIHRDLIRRVGDCALESVYEPWSSIVDDVDTRYRSLLKR